MANHAFERDLGKRSALPSAPSMRILLLVGGVIGLCIEAAIAVYAFAVNDSGHTGAEPFVAFLYFVPLLCVAVFVLWTRHLSKRTALFSASVAIVGILLVVLLDATNMLVQYERWAKRGLPEQGSVSWLK
jgi:drug/metabolite transporter (DMT)-like permease